MWTSGSRLSGYGRSSVAGVILIKLSVVVIVSHTNEGTQFQPTGENVLVGDSRF